MNASDRSSDKRRRSLVAAERFRTAGRCLVSQTTPSEHGRVPAHAPPARRPIAPVRPLSGTLAQLKLIILVPHPDPELSAPAAAALAKLSRRTRKKLCRRLGRLANGEVDPTAIRVLSAPPREPPWQEVALLQGILVSFRRLTDSERGPNPDAPLLLVGTIAPPERMQEARRQLRGLG